MFYFVGHFAMLHFVGAALASLRYGRLNFFWTPIPTFTGFNDVYPKDFGYGLWVTYLMWPIIVTLMYPLCRTLAKYKAEKRSAWVSYL
jgi:hypothetical protein